MITSASPRGMAETLAKSLTLTDLTLFGVASIMGSGGFNLIGEALRAGQTRWPLALGAAAAILMATAYSYASAYSRMKTNTAETDIIREQFGPVAEWVSTGAILTFNIISISTVLVMCAHLVLPGTSWLTQVSAALAALGGISAFSLAGIDVNKYLVNGASAGIVAVLGAAAALGAYGLASLRSPLPITSSATPTPNFLNSLLLFFFILAGFDSLMKFSQETKAPATDIPTSFFLSNGIADILTAGVAAAVAIWLPSTFTRGRDGANEIGHLFASFAGTPRLADTFCYLAVAFMIVTVFVVFLGTTRYLYGLAEQKPCLADLTPLNDAKAPYVAIGAIAAIAAAAILINHAPTLVKISNLGVFVMLAAVAAAVAKADWIAGSFFPALFNGGAAAAVTTLLGASIMKM